MLLFYKIIYMSKKITREKKKHDRGSRNIEVQDLTR